VKRFVNHDDVCVAVDAAVAATAVTIRLARRIREGASESLFVSSTLADVDIFEESLVVNSASSDVSGGL
jgi:hypothetical protein